MADITQTISNFPTAPDSSSDTPKEFNSKADAFVNHQAGTYVNEVNTWATQANGLRAEVNTIKGEAAAEATKAAESATSAKSYENSAKLARDDSKRMSWEAEAERKTAESYATEPYGVFVKEYTSNGDGTFTATDTTSYSALHWKTKAETAAGVVIDDSTKSTTKVWSSSNTYDQIKALSKVIAGVMFDFAGTTAPEGSLPCNGQEVSKTQYPKLYAAIGDVWATTGGVPAPSSGNFRLPPQEIGGKGVFSRGTGLGVGTYQEDDNKAHSHSASSDVNSVGHTHIATHDHTATVSNSGDHTHALNANTIAYDGTSSAAAASPGTGFGSYNDTQPSGSHTHTVTVDTKTMNTREQSTDHTHPITVDNSGGDETLPRSITVLKCIWTGE